MDKTSKIPNVLTMRQTMDYLQLSRSTIEKEIKSNHLRAIKLGGQYRFLIDDIKSYLDSQYINTINLSAYGIEKEEKENEI